MYKNSWVLVANGSEAKLFEATSNSNLEERATFSNDESRKKGSEVYTDKPGRSFDIAGKGRHAVGAQSSDVEMEKFAREINSKLLEIHTQGNLSQLFLVAGPKFLGLLLKQLDSNLVDLIKQKISKDLTNESAEHIREYLNYTL